MATNSETKLLIDLGWLRELDKGYQPFVRDVLSVAEMEQDYRPNAWRKIGERHNNMLAFLDAYVVTDHFICDRWAWLAAQGDRQDLNIPEAIKNIIQRENAEPAVYQSALEAAKQCRDDLERMGKNNPRLDALFKDMSKGFGQKDFLTDQLDWAQFIDRNKGFSLPLKGSLRFFSDSSGAHDVLRVFFYQAFAGQMNVMPFLSPHKLKILDTLDRRLEESVHQSVTKKVHSSMIGPGADTCFFEDVDIPPLTAMILHSAVNSGRDVMDVAFEIRNSENAKKYRQFLAELVELRHQCSVSRAAVPMLARKLRELTDLAQHWGQQGSAGHGVNYVLRTLRPGRVAGLAVPALAIPEFKFISVMFGALGFGRLAIKDPLLTKSKGHIAFVSSWYR